MHPTTRTAQRVGLAAVVAGLLFTLLAVPATAGANAVLPLHNDTAGAEDDCPDQENAYWHFVVTPNNGSMEIVKITLNLGDTEPAVFEGDDIIPNGDQLDNVFVAVPAGKTLESLELAGSGAEVLGTPKPNSKFNLSHVCTGDTPDTTPTTGGTDTTPPEGETTLPDVEPAGQGTRPAAVAGAVQTQPAFTG